MSIMNKKDIENDVVIVISLENDVSSWYCFICNKYRHFLWIIQVSCLLDYKLNKKKSTEKKDEKEDGKEVEVFIDNAFDARAELSEQGSHHEKAKGTAESWS